MLSNKIREREFLTVIVEEKDETFTIYVPELTGCIAVADTKEEIDQNTKEAILEYLNEVPEMFDNNPVDSIIIKKVKITF